MVYGGDIESGKNLPFQSLQKNRICPDCHGSNAIRQKGKVGDLGGFGKSNTDVVLQEKTENQNASYRHFKKNRQKGASFEVEQPDRVKESLPPKR